MKENIKEDIIALEQYLNAIDTVGTIDYKCINNLYEPVKNILSDHKRVLKENEELKADIKEYEKTFDIFNERTYRKKYLEERRAEQPNLLFPDADEIYERYYELKEENEELKYKYDRALEDLVKSKTKIKDKIKSYDGLKIIDKSAYEKRITPLKELLEEE